MSSAGKSFALAVYIAPQSRVLAAVKRPDRARSRAVLISLKGGFRLGVNYLFHQEKSVFSIAWHDFPRFGAGSSFALLVARRARLRGIFMTGIKAGKMDGNTIENRTITRIEERHDGNDQYK